jgi:hypothetical protein
MEVGMGKVIGIVAALGVLALSISVFAAEPPGKVTRIGYLTSQLTSLEAGR